MEINDLSDKEFKVMVIKMFTGIERRIDIQEGLQQRGIKYKKKNQSELKNTIT